MLLKKLRLIMLPGILWGLWAGVKRIRRGLSTWSESRQRITRSLKGKAMSLVGDLLDPLLGLVSAVPIAGPVAANLIGSVTGSAGPEGEAGLLGTGGGVLQGISDVATQVINAPLDLLGVGSKAGAVDVTGFSGGNGRFATRTTVETLDVVTGLIVKIKRMPGSPHLMNKDLSAARKVFRASAKLHSQMPRRTVRESATTKLKDAAVDAAIRRAQGDDNCPTIIHK